MPLLTIFAGPNGSGKSTLIQNATIEGKKRLLDADAIARRINPFNPAAAAIEAGREVLRCIDEYLDKRLSFAIEVTLSSRNFAYLIRTAKSRGYEVNLVFSCLNTPELSIHRVRIRVSKGGHFIPAEDVRRRYARSMANCKQAIRLVDFAKIYDNSGDGHRLVLIARSGEIVWRADPFPSWLDI